MLRIMTCCLGPRCMSFAFCPSAAPIWRRKTFCVAHHRIYCTSSAPWRSHLRGSRRENVGIPKGVEPTSGGQPAPTADSTPWEDYLLPTLRGNASPFNPSRYSPNAPPFFVLGVETSCDDTAAAVVRSDGTILGEAAVNQAELTSQWGGVVPHVARDAHAEAIDSVISRALSQANLQPKDLHAVAATMGPGLEICLRVGYRAARALARQHSLDFTGVNHLEAHVLVARLPRERDESFERMEFPFLTLLVSGGHCQLLLVRNVAEYEVIGGTLDDALGEAYDKTARLLGLDVATGGGPGLERLAMQGDPHSIPFPIPMRKRADCNFSFAGLKTSVRTAIEKLGGEEKVREDENARANIAASFQEIAVRHLEDRTARAMRRCEPFGVKSLVVSGGVAANQTIRKRLSQLTQDKEWRIAFPPVRLCTDNGVMVAWAGVERLQCGMATDTTRMDVRARWPLAKLGQLAGREVDVAPRVAAAFANSSLLGAGPKD